MTKSKQLNFKGEIIYCGVDVHKTNWKVCARMNNMEIATFSQNPEPALKEDDCSAQDTDTLLLN